MPARDEGTSSDIFTGSAGSNRLGGQIVKFEQSHLGICVSNLKRSLTFYRDGLGFQDGPSFEIDYPISEMSGDVRLISRFLHSGDLRIELLAFKRPKPFGRPSASRNQLGLTHLSFSVDDIDAAADRLVRFGGTIIEGTRSTPENAIHIIFLADPDGTRIELMKHTAGVEWPWYS
jgi:catechol 2,3-dioxygenase-like lactoylglutathione lyase family enzyme